MKILRHTKKKKKTRTIFVLILLIILVGLGLHISKNMPFGPVRTADLSRGWNLILVNGDYRIPNNYQNEVELTTLSNGKQVDSRIYPDLQVMFDDARAEGLQLFVREGYRTREEQQQLLDDKIAAYLNESVLRKMRAL